MDEEAVVHPRMGALLACYHNHCLEQVRLNRRHSLD